MQCSLNGSIKQIFHPFSSLGRTFVIFRSTHLLSHLQTLLLVNHLHPWIPFLKWLFHHLSDQTSFQPRLLEFQDNVVESLGTTLIERAQKKLEKLQKSISRRCEFVIGHLSKLLIIISPISIPQTNIDWFFGNFYINSLVLRHCWSISSFGGNIGGVPVQKVRLSNSSISNNNTLSTEKTTYLPREYVKDADAGTTAIQHQKTYLRDD
jgi:hypothetical protein